MKKIQSVLFGIALLAFCSSPILSQTNGSGGFIRADEVRYQYNCGPGFIGIQQKGCQLHVQFFEWFDKAGFNLQTAQQICKQNGWVLATPQEVKAAWENIQLDHFAFGMMADGSFAAPIQKDYRHFKKGPNIGVKGGNQGFFYVEAVAAPRGRQSPATTQNQNTGTTGGGIIVSGSGQDSYYPNGSNAVPDHAPDPVVGVAMAHCDQGANAPNNPTDNWMMEMWPNPVTLSSNSLLVQAGKSYLYKKGFQVNDKSMQTLAVAVKNDPVARFKFAPFLLQECFNALLTPNPNSAQLEYKRAFQEHQSCEDYNRAVRTWQEWEAYQGRGAFSGPPAYSPTLLSSVNYNSRPSVDAFLNSDPLQFGAVGGETVGKLYLPMQAKNGLLEDVPTDGELAKLGDDMTNTAVAAGIGGAAGAASLISVGTYGFVKASIAGILAQNSAGAAKIAAKTGVKVSVKAASKILANATSAAGITAVVAVSVVAACILGTVAADAAKTDAYERKVKAEAHRVQNFQVTEFLNTPGEDPKVRRSALFTLMVKHLIAKPANSRRLSLELPPLPLPTEYTAADIDALPSEKLKVVKFHAQNFITMAEAQRLATQNSWTIATAAQVENAWTYHNLDVYAFGMMADGRFAVPVQKDHSNFKKGPNIGAVGGNQGFFYTSSENPPGTTPTTSTTANTPTPATTSTTNSTTTQPKDEFIDPNATYYITDAKHNKSLVTGMVYGGGVYHQTPRNSPEDASWYFLPTGDGYYYIYDLRFNKALAGPDYYDHFGGSTHYVYHQDPNGRTNAQWKITPSDVPGKYIITDRKHNNSLVAGDVADNNIYLQPHNNRQNAYWTFTVTKDKAPANKPNPNATTNQTATTTPVTTTPATKTQTTNVAINKPSKQSSYYGNQPHKFGPGFANDGDILKQNKGGDIIMCTNRDNNPWWEVDLLDTYTITEINLYNRINCCPDRLANFTILVSDQPFTGNNGGTVFTQRQPAPPGTDGKGTYTGNATGRYVRLFLEGYNYLSIPEIEIFGSLAKGTPAVVSKPPAATKTANVAINKPSKQSSYYGNQPHKFGPGFANDGDILKQNKGGDIIMCTNRDNNPWWEVDLLDTYTITEINLYNRINCCPDRLANFTILVSDQPFTGNNGGTVFTQRQPAPPGADGKGTYTGNATGRYVRLFIEGYNYLSIPEIEIFGSLARGAAATQANSAATSANNITPLNNGFVRFQNNGEQTHYIHNQNGKLEAGQIQPDWLGAQWKFVTYGGGLVNIQSRSNPNLYLNNNNGQLEVVNIATNRASALWKIVPAPAGNGWAHIQNSLSLDQYIRHQNGKVELGTIDPNSGSAMWKVE